MKKINHKFRVILIFSFAFLLVSGFNKISAQKNDNASAALKHLMTAHPIVGLSVVVVKKDKVVYKESFGSKNLEKNIPLTNNNLFRIASVSKSFTSTGIMQLVEKKVLSLDDDVSKLIGFSVRNPKFPDKKITIRMLLSHTSSINDSQGYFSLNTINPAQNPDWQKCYNDYAPGGQYEYCNFNFNLAGTILEKYSGERFDHYILNHILKPLNIYGGFNVNDLDSSLFANIYEYDPDSSRFINSPAAYAPRKKEIAEYVMGYSTPIFSPAGGMKITATGLSTYMMMHMENGKFNGKRIIKKKSEKTIRRAVSKEENYGLGLLTTRKLISGETLVGHTGSAYGLQSCMFFEPKKQFGIVVICNGCPESSEEFNVVIREAVNTLYQNVILTDDK